MKSLRNLIAVAALVSVISTPTFAGEITTGIASPPPSRAATAANGEITTGVTGQIDIPAPNGDISTTSPTSDSLIQAALNLVRGVLSLF